MTEIMLSVVFAFVALLVGHAIGKVRDRVVITTLAPDHSHGQLHTLLNEVTRIFANEMKQHRPRNLLGFSKPFELHNYRGGLNSRFYENIPDHDDNFESLTSADIAACDPDGKVAAMARRLAAKVLAAGRPVAFYTPELPPGLYFSGRCKDEDTRVVVRMLRGYDIQIDCFVTQLSCEVRVE